MNPNEIYHVYNRGNNRQPIFLEKENYYYFLEKAQKYLAPNCDILAYCLMPNHFHFLIAANERTNLLYRSSSSHLKKKKLKKNQIQLTLFSRGLQLTLSSYTRGINKKFNRTGSLFQQNTKTKRTSCEAHLEDYSLWCFIYIHNNPQECGMVNSPYDYEFTSYKDYLDNRKNSICNIELGKKLLALEQNDLFKQQEIVVPSEIVERF